VLQAAGLITLADKGYQGSTWAKISYRAGKLAKAIHALQLHEA
jgi:hypothetical protein